MKTYAIYFCLALLLFPCLQLAQSNGISVHVIEGRLYLVGNEPFTELAIETREGEVYVLRGQMLAELKSLQGHQVKLEGRILENQHFSYASKGLLVEGWSRILSDGGAND